MATDTVIRGLAGLKQQQERNAPAGGGDFKDRPKATYVSLKDGDSVKMYVLQELDEGSPNYSSKNGVGIFVLVHANPDNWQKSAKCTADLGECYGCKMGWRTKTVLYINVLIDDGKSDPYVAIWNRALGKNSVVNDLVNVASDEDFDYSVTDKSFKFSRTGKTKDDTTYTLTNIGKANPHNVEEFELFDLEQYVFTVAPDRQENYYTDGQSGSDAPSEPAKVAVSPAAVDAEW